jgi:integrase
MATRKILKTLHRIDPLTLRRIGEGKYRARQRALHDGGGLYLRLRPGGGSWAFRYERDGAKVWMGLGSLQQVDAPTAREQARQFRQSLGLGEHPLYERREERRQQRAERQAASATFKAVAEQVLIAFERSTLHEKTRRSWRQVIETYALPTLGAKLIDDIERADVLEVLRPIWGSKVDTSRKLRRRIEHIFDEAITMGLSNRPNPARWAELKRPLAAFTAEKPPGHHRALPWRQVPALMKRLAANGSLSAAALRLTILAATRTGETLGARFIDFAHGRWTIPGDRMKGGKEHRVPVTTGIEALLADLDYGRKLSPLLFANPSTGEALSNMAMLTLLKGMGIDATVHGFRSSFRDWAADHAYPREVAEAALAHVVPGVEGAYLRSDVFARRKEMMEAWSDFCLGRTGTAGQLKSGKRASGGKK